MAALKQRLARLEERIDGLPANRCPSCHGFGHPARSIRPLIGNGATELSFGPAVLVQDERVDANGCCEMCGATSVLAPTVELELPMLQAQRRRLC